MDIILVAAASLSVIFIVTGLTLAITSPRSAVMGRLEKAAGGGPAAGQETKKTGLKEDFMWVLGRLGRLPARGSKLQEIQGNLVKADVMMRAEEYVGLVILVAVAVYVVVFLLSGSAIVGILAGAVSLFVPGVIVNMKKRKRSEAMTYQLPEALNIISSGLRAGFSFPQALSVVIREMEGPLTQEFSRVLRENRLGKPMDDCLNDLLMRIENDDLELLVTALQIQRQVGGNLAEVLDGISHTIRERVRIKGEIKTLTAEGRLSAIILILLPFAIFFFIYISNPGYILTLTQDILGIIMIIGASIMMVIGIFVIRKIVAIDV